MPKPLTPEQKRQRVYTARRAITPILTANPHVCITRVFRSVQSSQQRFIITAIDDDKIVDITMHAARITGAVGKKTVGRVEIVVTGGGFDRNQHIVEELAHALNLKLTHTKI